MSPPLVPGAMGQAEPSHNPAHGAGHGGGTLLRQHTMHDPQSGNMESHTILVPEGWQVEGGAWWAPSQAFRILPSQHIVLSAPDGRQVRIGPSISFQHYQPSPLGMQYGAQSSVDGSVANGYPVMAMPADEQAWKQWVAQHVVRDSFPQAQQIRVLSIQELPELSQGMAPMISLFQQQVQQQNQMALASGFAMRSYAGGGGYGVTSQFVLNGQHLEMLWIVGLLYQGTDMEVGRDLGWTLEPNVAIIAPVGELEAQAPLLMGLITTLQPTPQWAQMVRQHQQAMQRIDAKGAADRAAIRAETNREISRIQNEGWQARQDSNARGHRSVIQAITGVADYSTGDGSSAVLPNTHSHVYSNGQGEYFFSNDPLFDPNANRVNNSNNWTQMQVQR